MIYDRNKSRKTSLWTVIQAIKLTLASTMDATACIRHPHRTICTAGRFRMSAQSANALAKILNRLLPTTQCASNPDQLEVLIPPTQHDMLHVCDIYEDVAIAYGYNRITATMHIAQQYPLNKLTEQLWNK